MPVEYELKSLKRAAVEWKSPWLEIGRQTAARIRDDIDKREIDLTESGSLADVTIGAVRVAADRLELIYRGGDESDKLLAFALADFIENNYKLESQKLTRQAGTS